MDEPRPLRLPMPRPVPTLRGGIVTLRALDPAKDAADYFEFNLDPRMHTWTGNNPFATLNEASAELQRFTGMADITTWAIVDNASGVMIGRFFVCLERRGERLIAGEGNRVAVSFWRRGHNRNARQLVFGYVFEVLGADSIESVCWADNVNSRLSLLAHRFELVQITPAFNPKHNKVLDKCFFRFDRKQWPGSAQGLAGSSPVR